MRQTKRRHLLLLAKVFFFYKVMPFVLINAGAAYQRLVNHMFCPQIGRNVEVYVDDMLVKRLDEEKHLDNI